jgi:hypothetical protein
MPLDTLDRGRAARLLAAAGLQFEPSELQVEAREERWLVRLPGRYLAWVAASARGLEALRSERRVLRLLETRCSFQAPRLFFESDDGDLDVRSIVPGTATAQAVYEQVGTRREVAVRLGSAIGAILAEQHSRIGAADVAEWLPRRPAWPERRDWIRERLPSVVPDVDLIARADAVIGAYDEVRVADADRALVHTDVGFHNLAIDPTSFAVNGIFDYDSAAWADRHHDFRYLIFDIDHYELFDAASSVYEGVVGHAIRRDRVLLYNAACAISYLAFRAGIAPEERWCGRTLAEDLRWSEHAIEKALGPPLRRSR